MPPCRTREGKEDGLRESVERRKKKNLAVTSMSSSINRLFGMQSLVDIIIRIAISSSLPCVHIIVCNLISTICMNNWGFF